MSGHLASRTMRPTADKGAKQQILSMGRRAVRWESQRVVGIVYRKKGYFKRQVSCISMVWLSTGC